MTLSLRTIVFIILISDAVTKNVIAFLTNATDKENNTKEYDTNPNTTHINYTELNILKWPQYFWFTIGFGTGVLIMLIINAKLYCQVWCPNNRIFRILRRRFVIWYNRCFSINIYSVSAEQIVMSRSECTSSAAQLEQRTSSAATQSTSFVSQLRQSTSTLQLPRSTSSASKLPQSTSLDSQLPQITSFASKLPQSQSLDSKLPARSIRLPVSQLPAPTSTVRQLPGPTPLSKLPQASLPVSQFESYKLLKLERYMKRHSPYSSTFSRSVPLMSELLQSQSPNTQLRFIKSMSSVTNQSQSSQ
ncbi:uncharacterized protein [Temnothorax nylanderi]|uniref:uncharacterized protein n=1 Tax=Temnothorax nylanderi TaxID=102681 RepID=UPI003A84641A